MKDFLFPPNSLLSIDLPGISPLPLIPPLSHIFEKNIFFTNHNHISKSTPFLSAKRLREKENQHFYKASLVQGHMTFCMFFYYTTIHPLKTIFVCGRTSFLKSGSGTEYDFIYPSLQYQIQEQVHSTCSVNIC